MHARSHVEPAVTIPKQFMYGKKHCEPFHALLKGTLHMPCLEIGRPWEGPFVDFPDFFKKSENGLANWHFIISGYPSGSVIIGVQSLAQILQNTRSATLLILDILVLK